MFIEPLEVKATKANQEYGVEAPKTENLKTYVYSNNFKTGNGANAWRANSRIAKQELFGAWTQSQNDDTYVVESEEEEEETPKQEENPATPTT